MSQSLEFTSLLLDSSLKAFRCHSSSRKQKTTDVSNCLQFGPPIIRPHIALFCLFSCRLLYCHPGYSFSHIIETHILEKIV